MEHIASAIISKSSFMSLPHRCISWKPAVITALPVLSVCERWPYGLLSANRTPSWHRHVTNVDERTHEITLLTVQHVDKLCWWLLTTTTISLRNLDGDDFTETLISNSANSRNNPKSNNNLLQIRAKRRGDAKIGKREVPDEDSDHCMRYRFNKRSVRVILVLKYNSGKPKWLNVDRAMSY